MSVQLSGALDVSTVLNEVAFATEDVLLAEDGVVQYFPAQTGWAGGFYPPNDADAIELKLGKSCKIKVNAPVTVTLTGTVPMNGANAGDPTGTYQFQFPAGWSWTGIPDVVNLPINNFLPDIWEEGDTILTENEGSVTYFPAQTGWDGGWYPPTAQLTHFKPGILYKFKRATAVNATFTL